MLRKPSMLSGLVAAACLAVVASCTGTDDSDDFTNDASRGRATDSDRVVNTANVDTSLDLRAVHDAWFNGECKCLRLANPRVQVSDKAIGLIGVGRVIAIAEGPDFRGGTPSVDRAPHNTLVRVRMDDVYRGDVNSGDTIYLIQDTARPAKQLQRSLPAGTTIGVYAERFNTSTLATGRLNATSVWKPTLQGFIVPGTQGVAYVGDEIDRRHSLADVMPSSVDISE